MKPAVLAVAFGLSSVVAGCAGVMEWANTQPSNRLANGRCLNPNDATTTIECEQQPPPIARPAPRPENAAATQNHHDDDSFEAARAEVLTKARQGLDAEAARLFWALPQESRTTAFSAAVTQARAERISSLDANPRDVAEAVGSLKLDAFPGDHEVLEALGGRINQTLVNLTKRPEARSQDLKLGVIIVRAVQRYSTETASAASEGLAAFEDRYAPLLIAGNDADDLLTFLKLYPDTEYASQIGDRLVQLAQVAVLEQEGREADRLWDAVQAQGDNLAQLQFKIAFATAQFDPQRARLGIRSMHLHLQMLVKDAYCPAKKECVDALGAASFNKRAIAHCKDDPPTESGIPGIGVPMTNECKAAFATGC
ncbi:MAG: hypothetical protein WDO69_33695 [Pseudomonadota bacterium]